MSEYCPRCAVSWTGVEHRCQPLTQSTTTNLPPHPLVAPAPVAVPVDDQTREALWDAVGTVYSRHDHTLPLNHVNRVEWVEAVLPVVAAAVKDAQAEAWDQIRDFAVKHEVRRSTLSGPSVYSITTASLLQAREAALRAAVSAPGDPS